MFFLSPKIAYANVDTLIANINRVIINPIITFIFALALLYFIYGVVMFVANADSEDKRAEGQRHMLWGIVGMFIMISAFAILRLIGGTIGADTSIIPS